MNSSDPGAVETPVSALLGADCAVLITSRHTVLEIRAQLFALCEDMADEAFTNLGRVDLDAHETGYYRGMKYAAKATARAMGEVFREMLADGTLEGQDGPSNSPGTPPNSPLQQQPGGEG